MDQWQSVTVPPDSHTDGEVDNWHKITVFKKATTTRTVSIIVELYCVLNRCFIRGQTHAAVT